MNDRHARCSARRYLVSGRVQGVAFRHFTRAEAERLGVGGWARNLADGRVEVLAWAGTESLDAFERWLHRGPPAARVSEVEVTQATPGDGRGFEIR